MISCPNKSLPSWKELVDSVGELDATALWNKYNGEVPKSYYKTDTESSSEGSTSVDLNDLVDENAEPIFSESLGEEESVPEEVEETPPIEFVKPTIITFANRLNVLVGKALDNVTQVYNKANAYKPTKNKADYKKHLKNIKTLKDDMESLVEVEKLQAIVHYAKAMARTVAQVEKSMTRLYKITDFRKEDVTDVINRYEDYLASYDLLDEIRDIVAVSRREKLSDEDAASLAEVETMLNELSGKHANLLSNFKDLKREQSIKTLSKPEYNTQVETDHRIRLYAEHARIKPVGENRIEYAARMLATRDKDIYKADLIASAERLANDPTFDITSFKKNWGDALNTDSKLIQIVVNIVNSVRDTILKEYENYNNILGDLYEDIKKERGSKPPSEQYKNVLEQDKDGNYFFKGKYKIEFRDKYIEEFVPLKQALSEIAIELSKQGMAKLQFKTDPKYKEAFDATRVWLKANTVTDDTGGTKESWVPNKSYLNPKLTGLDLQIQQEALSVLRFSSKATGGSKSLIRKAGSVSFYKLPAITKSTHERAAELDGKGIFSDIKKDFTEIRPDDIGYGEAVDNKNEVIKRVKVHFRGNLEADQQSLDVLTLLRKEYLNALNYTHKSKAETTIKVLADISKNKQYFQVSKKTGLPLLNIFNKNQPVETVSGEHSNELARIKGIMERNLYDTLSEHGGTFLGVDVNKLTNFINGTTASIAMSFNLASGTANVFNGFTQLAIESFGGDVYSKSSLLKAEKMYTLDLPNILADLANPVKKSFTNQVLKMFDIMGGFDPETQDFIKDNVAKKLLSKESLNGLNEMGEHAMNSILTMATLNELKVMNADYKFIDKNGKVVANEKDAASVLDMLSIDENNQLQSSKLFKYTKHNLTVDYHEGGKTHINLLIKKKAHDLFGVYDANFKNEVSKQWLGKALMMFKNFFLSGMEYRYTGISSSWTNRADLTDEQLTYNSAQKEYIEGTYTTMVRYFKEGVIPALKSLQMAHLSDNYNALSDHQKSNLKKATLELALTTVILPAIGLLLAGAAGDDDDELWFLIYQFRRLESELSQFRNPQEATKLLTNPVAGMRFIQSTLNFVYEVITPLDFAPDDDEHFFSYLNENSKGQNKLLKSAKKITIIGSQLDKDYKNLHSLINK